MKNLAAKTSQALLRIACLLLTSTWPGYVAAQEPGASADEAGSGRAAAAENGSFDFGQVPDELLQALRESRELSLAECIAAVSAPLLGRPYLQGATGEGRGVDPDPPVRYDAFDCVTFIEEVLALALAPDPGSAALYRNALRFHQGRSSYEERNHFFAAQWIPRNLANGLLRDITAELGQAQAIRKLNSPAVWQAWRHRARFALSDQQLPTGELTLPILSLDQAQAAADRIPAGALIVTVRVPLTHNPIVVSHVGITVPAEQTTMRHATKMGGKRVRDDGLAWYLKHLESYVNWPVAGINVLLPLEQGPRRQSALEGSAGPTGAERPPSTKPDGP